MTLDGFSSLDMKKWHLVGIIAFLAVATGLLLIPNLVAPRAKPARHACVANLEYIERAKLEWATKHSTNTDVVLTPKDLFGDAWINKMVVCPAGGAYQIGTLHERATCSLGPPIHSLP